MNRLWAPVLACLACATAGGLACSRSNMLAAQPDGSAGRRGWDASADVQSPVDVQVPPDAVTSDLAGRSDCGNGRLDPGEECDDGNTLDGDDCSKDCRLDGCALCGGMCPGCPPGRGPRCGDGLVTSDEICDDGNAVSGDGCAGDCKTIEAGYRCPMPGRRCLPICGDGLLAGWELLLPAEPSCAPADQPGALCGDGLITRYEECDCGSGLVPFPEGCEGPNDDGYGHCTTKCTWGPFCGDGKVNGPEECDLGNKNGTLGQDGCTAGCTKPPTCGDGNVDTLLGEECDLGDLNGVRLDREGKPSNHPDALVHCRTDCRIGLLRI